MKLKNILSCILILFVCVLTVPKVHAMQLTFACENKQDFPTVMGNSKDVLETNPGMGIEAVWLLAKKLNIEIEIKRMPWKRCLSEMEKGNVDGVFTASFKEKRKQYGLYPEKDGNVDPSRRFTSASYALYRLKGTNVNYDGNNFLNIKGKVGAPRGYSIADDLRKKGLTIDEGPSTEKDFIKMIKGRLDAVAALEMTGDYYILSNDDFQKKIEKILPLIVEKPYYYMISHQFYNKNKDFAEKIWDTIAEIRKDSEFQKRLKNYLQ